jgi:pterin-4a-carbinolamine dehydratase
VKNLTPDYSTMTGEKLSDEEIGEALDDLDIWGVKFEKLATRVEFDDYRNAVEFANKVFSLVEDSQASPEVKVTVDAVEIDAWTPDVGITDEDVKIAGEIEQELREMHL